MAKKLKDPTKLFDFIDILFSDENTFNQLKPYEKARHFFMTNRFMSIQYPLQANHLQHIRINPSEVINYWQSTMRRLYTRTPNWMYTKTKSVKKETDTYTVSDDTIKEYCNRMNCSRREIDELLKFYPENTTKELKKFEKLLKQ